MAALDSTYRKPDVVLSPIPSVTSTRRATVGSPPSSSYPWSNTFESPRPLSRSDRFAFGHPYRSRRSTVSGHSHGHNVNDAPPITVHGDPNTMWSNSASPSPVMPNAVLLPGPSPTPSSSCGSPKPSHPTFEYEHVAFSHTLQSPMTSSFTLCQSPEFPNPMDQPRTMPPPLLPGSFCSGAGSSTTRPSTACNSGTSTTPALSPAASSTSFAFDTTVGPSNSSSPRQMPDHSMSSQPQTREELDSEMLRLRQRVRDLEFINDLVRLRVAELESADNKTRVQSELGLGLQLTTTDMDTSSTSYTSSSTPQNSTSRGFSLLHHEPGSSPSDWPARTGARLKRFCGLNRAGNALCAWHDSRRERRAYPPRMAPPNTLNCGCTFAEALFEESLARNGVGAFYPGENVRMDPALRNPLLKLLEERYGYRDGDFERTADGGWREGEDAHSWEHKGVVRTPSRRER